MLIQLGDRHPETQRLMRYFDVGHLPTDLQQVSAPLGHAAAVVLSLLPDGPELTAGLRKLVEAKDCFVRHAVENRE